MKSYITGYRPAVYARQGLMLGIRQPLDGPVFEKWNMGSAERGAA